MSETIVMEVTAPGREVPEIGDEASVRVASMALYISEIRTAEPVE